MLAFPNCKINLGLNVTGKRPDGYHNIESIFYPVDCCDMLEIIPGGSSKGDSKIINFTCSGIPVPGEMEDNLCVKAYKLLDQLFNLPPVRIHLHKIIPIGAGLGGGSADGAYALKLLNKMFGLQQIDSQLEHFAAQIGSDCSFFIRNQPAFVHGRGEIMEPVDLDLKPLNIMIVYPPVAISTAQAFAAVSPSKGNKENLKNLIARPISTWKDAMVNDFEESIFSMYPELEKIKSQLYKCGALYAAMSGSGSAVFGLFEKTVKPIKQFEGYKVFQIKA